MTSLVIDSHSLLLYHLLVLSDSILYRVSFFYFVPTISTSLFYCKYQAVMLYFID